MMFGFLAFGRRRRARLHEKQREMVRVALNSVLRRRGFATSSLGCELIAFSRPGAAGMMLVQLLIRTWDDRLIHEAVDLENELLDVICLYGHSKRAADFLVSWKFALDTVAARAAPKAAEPEIAPPPKLTAVPSSAPVFKFDLPKTDLDLDDDERHHEYGFPATVIRNQ